MSKSMLSRAAIRAAAVCCACGPLAAAPARADTAVTWRGGTGTSWHTAANWSGGVVPNNGTPTGAAYVVTVDAAPAVASVVTVGRAATVNGLTVDAGDAVTVNSGGSLSVSGLTNAGTVTANAGGTLTVGATRAAQSATGRLVAGGGTISVAAPFTVTSGQSLGFGTGGRMTFAALDTNGFAVLVGPSGALNATTLTNPTGSVQVHGGSLNVSNPYVVTGAQSVSLRDGGRATFGALTTTGHTVSVPAGTSLSAARLTNDNGTVEGGGAVSLGAFTNAGGVLRFTGNAAVTTPHSFTPAALDNAGGVVSLADGATYAINGSLAVSGGTWRTTGTAAFTAAGPYYYSAPAFRDLTLDGTLNLGANVSLAGTLTNHGTINVNPGRQYVRGGTLTLAGGGTVNMNFGDVQGLPSPLSDFTIVNRGNTIRGVGNLNVINSAAVTAVDNVTGVIEATPSPTDPNAYLAVGGHTVTNRAGGTMRVAPGGYLYVRAGRFDSAGPIEVGAGGRFKLVGDSPGSPAAAASSRSAGTVEVAGVTAAADAIAGGDVSVFGFGKLAVGRLDVNALRVEWPATVTLRPSRTAAPPAPAAGAGDAAGDGLVNSLAILGQAAVDVTDRGLTIRYGTGPDPVADVAAYLRTGYNDGAWYPAGNDWDMRGLTSSAAAADRAYGLGYADAADGLAPGLAAGTIRVRYTLYGDANLDERVDSADFSLLASHFGRAVPTWAAGDFNYDGRVDSSDFSLLASNFGRSAAGGSVSLTAADWAALESFGAAVPEPASAGLLGLAGLGVLGSRRHRRG